VGDTFWKGSVLMFKKIAVNREHQSFASQLILFVALFPQARIYEEQVLE